MLRPLCRALTQDLSQRELTAQLSSMDTRAQNVLTASIIGHGLQSIAYTQLPATPAVDQLKSNLKPAILKQASISLLQHKVVLDFAQVIDQLGIPFVLIKGTALAYLYYPEPHLRPRGDIDVLLSEHTITEVYHHLLQRGYHCETLVTPLSRAKYLTTQFICRLPNASVDFDMHWQISNTLSLAQTLNFSELIADAVSVAGLAPTIKTPHICHAFLIACIHWTAEPNKRLIWLYDLHVLNAHMSERHWHQLLSLVIERKCSAILLSCLDQTHSWFGTRFNAGAMQQLRQYSATNPREPTRFLTNRKGQLQERYVDFLSFNWKQRAQLITTLLFPPYSYLQRQFPNSAGASALAYIGCYIKRLVNTFLPASRT